MILTFQKRTQRVQEEKLKCQKNYACAQEVMMDEQRHKTLISPHYQKQKKSPLTGAKMGEIDECLS